MTLENLKKITIFDGPNGAGKTTSAKFMRDQVELLSEQSGSKYSTTIFNYVSPLDKTCFKLRRIRYGTKKVPEEFNSPISKNFSVLKFKADLMTLLQLTKSNDYFIFDRSVLSSFVYPYICSELPKMQFWKDSFFLNDFLEFCYKKRSQIDLMIFTQSRLTRNDREEKLTIQQAGCLEKEEIIFSQMKEMFDRMWDKS